MILLVDLTHASISSIPFRSKSIDRILKELKKLPNRRLTIDTGENFLKGPEGILSNTYKSAEVYDTLSNKIGILNNIVASFSNSKLKLFSGNTAIDKVDEFGASLYLKTTNPRFRINLI